MADETGQLTDWLQGLIGALEPAARKSLNRRIAVRLRKANADRIAAQVEPDGSSFEKRKSRAEERSGRIRRRKMFLKARQTKHMKRRWSADDATVQFTGSAAKILRVHHYGLRDRVAPGGKRIEYPRRRLLGFAAEDEEAVADLVLQHLTDAQS